MWLQCLSCFPIICWNEIQVQGMACEDFWDHLASLRSPGCFCAQGVWRSLLCDGKKKGKIQSGYFLWVHLGVGVYIEMVRYGGWKNPGFMIFHEVSSMIKGDDPGKTPALDDESWVVYRVGLPIWMLFFLRMIFGYKKLGRCTSEIFKKDRHLQEIYGNMGTNKRTGIKLGVASQLESG